MILSKIISRKEIEDCGGVENYLRIVVRVGSIGWLVLFVELFRLLKDLF